jgi:hypothetical protein
MRELTVTEVSQVSGGDFVESLERIAAVGAGAASISGAVAGAAFSSIGYAGVALTGLMGQAAILGGAVAVAGMTTYEVSTALGLGRIGSEAGIAAYYVS